LLTLLTLSTSACVSAPPTNNPWSEQQRAEDFAVYPIEIPELESDLSNLDEVLEAAIGNYDIAEANAETLIALSRAYNDLLAAGEAEFELAESRRRLLEEERRARLWDKLSTWSILAILGAGAAIN